MAESTVDLARKAVAAAHRVNDALQAQTDIALELVWYLAEARYWAEKWEQRFDDGGFLQDLDEVLPWKAEDLTHGG